jgi:hypothetical protein
MIKGMAKVIDAPPRRPRRAVRAQDLKEALDGLPADFVSAVNARACASVGFCGLLRAAEMSLQRGQAWSKARSLSRAADVRFLVRPGEGRPAEWVSFDELDSAEAECGSTQIVVAAKVMMRPCKKLRYRGNKTVPVLLFDGSILKPVTELLRLFRVDRVPPEACATTPLFRRALGKPYTTDYVREVVRFLMSSVGLPPLLYGGHTSEPDVTTPQSPRTMSRR